jgi:hypothetical protein
MMKRLLALNLALERFIAACETAAPAAAHTNPTEIPAKGKLNIN